MHNNPSKETLMNKPKHVEDIWSFDKSEEAYLQEKILKKMVTDECHICMD